VDTRTRMHTHTHTHISLSRICLMPICQSTEDVNF